MRENIIREKAFAFAVKIVDLCRYLQKSKKDFVLSKQLLRSGTAIGALIREAEYAESKLDFIHKLSIAQKECNESIYWVELLERTRYLSYEQLKNIKHDALEILKIMTTIIKTAKLSINK